MPAPAGQRRARVSSFRLQPFQASFSSLISREEMSVVALPLRVPKRPQTGSPCQQSGLPKGFGNRAEEGNPGRCPLGEQRRQLNPY